MTGKEFKVARKKLGLSQCDVAARLGVSQPYVALMERGKRHFPPELVRKAVSLLKMSPSALPLDPRPNQGAEWLTRQLSALGYPGYAHVRRGRMRNPVELLLAALGEDNLEARIVEALPWLLLRYGAMDETCTRWLVEQARSRNLTNRLGFTVTLARQVAEQKGEATLNSVYQALVKLEEALLPNRLAEPDTFCQRHLSQRQREWMEAARPDAARQWNLLTHWKPEDLQYV